MTGNSTNSQDSSQTISQV